MEYIAAGKRGDLAKMADISFDCIMCGLCTSRGPAELAQYNYALLARRLYAKYIAKPARHLQASLEELRNKKFDGEIDKLMKLSQAELAKLYAARNIEP
jgi:succinate dehydrogenase/fumarate reductase-like Fe-S protein